MGFLNKNKIEEKSLSTSERNQLLAEIDSNTNDEELMLLSKAIKDRTIKKQALQKLRQIFY